MADFALIAQPGFKLIDLSKIIVGDSKGPSEAKVVAVPLPKKTFGVIFGQRTAGWTQGFNSYLLDSNYLPLEPSALWVADESDECRAMVTQIVPPGFAKDPSVFSVGPFSDDRYIAILATHKGPKDSQLVASDPKFQYHAFTIGSETKPAVRFTMINAEDGGDSDYHDLVVGVAVVATTKK
ncbi:hypothetical protein R3P38DRAFT_3040205 [Favolaschia claudopus]|uniref:Uncharacterized protein n=1 Tax=Favolaschia claudopus TaxID=2862362 RepID=A0AAW0AAP3_9AGAR